MAVLLQSAAGEESWQELAFSTSYENSATGFRLPVLTPKHFSFNSHLGACVHCQGLGVCLEMDPDLVVPDPDKTLAEGAIAPWARVGKKLEQVYQESLGRYAAGHGVSMDIAWSRLPESFRHALLYGASGAASCAGDGGSQLDAGDAFAEGVLNQLQALYVNSESDASRQRLRQFMSNHPCGGCVGARLRPELLAVRLRSASGDPGRGLGIAEVCKLSIADAWKFVDGLLLEGQQQVVTSEVRRELGNRLHFLNQVGLGYLSLDRQSGTLSGGEFQRIRLATQIGSGLAGCMYVLDEPSIGLHQRDNDRLIGTLHRLRDLGNSVIVVEHDEDTIRAADYVVDLGPGAGVRGGNIVAAGTPAEVARCATSLTGLYLSGEAAISVPKSRVRPQSARARVERGHIPPGWLSVIGASENNLQEVDAHFPLGLLTCVTGVSGSGKSTLVDDVLRRALARRLHRAKERPGKHKALLGTEQVDKVIVIDQAPIGRTPRSNPVTYSAAFGPIRELFSGLPASRVRGYDAGRFSFNVKGGRCESCEGDGVKKIEMHFLADVFVECEACHGRRYNRETLEITYKGRNIADVLDMTVDEACRFFKNVPQVFDKLVALEDVGLGYVRLGQSGATLSGGEAQRVKLAAELAKKATGRTVYILDEPTTGLHFADIQKLLEVLSKLRDAGNTLIIIEHNLEVIKTADWILDLGPEGGTQGGRILVEGPPEAVVQCPESHTGTYLRRVLP
jgi:excinuclease ABC subunit A